MKRIKILVLVVIIMISALAIVSAKMTKYESPKVPVGWCPLDTCVPEYEYAKKLEIIQLLASEKFVLKSRYNDEKAALDVIIRIIEEELWSLNDYSLPSCNNEQITNSLRHLERSLLDVILIHKEDNISEITKDDLVPSFLIEKVRQERIRLVASVHDELGYVKVLRDTGQSDECVIPGLIKRLEKHLNAISPSRREEVCR